jgi:YfiH family protein
MKSIELDIGKIIHFNEFIVFFGNKNSSYENIKTKFKDYTYCRLDQVHGDKVVSANQGFDKADAHYTNKINHALTIKTADCLPIFVTNSKTKYICGIHAGWRGIANQITKKAIHELLNQNSIIGDLSIFVGPHIMLESFEVDQLTAKMLLETVKYKKENFFRKLNNNKFLISLDEILKQQLFEIGINSRQIYFFNEDTKTNLNYHSFRRDREQSGRQISYVVRV